MYAMTLSVTIPTSYMLVYHQHSVCVLCHCGQVQTSANRNPHWRDSNPFENRFSNIITHKLSRLDESSNLKWFRHRNNKPLNLQLGNPRCPSLWRAHTPPSTPNTYKQKHKFSNIRNIQVTEHTRSPNFCFIHHLHLPLFN